MKSPVVFLAGALAGAALMQVGSAQNDPVPPRDEHQLSHIGLVVGDYDAEYAFYTQKLGLKEAYTVERDGRPLLTYLHLNRDTFVELIPARGSEARGITHYGVEVADIEDFVAHLRAQGVEVADPGVTPANARYVRVRDPEGIELEVMELGPESSQRKAMAVWQP